jgi:hypothetical protein
MSYLLSIIGDMFLINSTMLEHYEYSPCGDKKVCLLNLIISHPHMGTGDDSDRHQQIINDLNQKQTEIDTSSSVESTTTPQSDLSYEGSGSYEFDEEGNLVQPKTYDESIVESVSETEMELLKAYNEAGTISEAAELLGKPATQVATMTLDGLQDEYSLVTVEEGNVDYTFTGEQVVDELEPNIH